MGAHTYFIRKQNLPCEEPNTYIIKETYLWGGDGIYLGDLLTDLDPSRCVVDRDELMDWIQELLSEEKLGSDDEYNRKTLTLLAEVLSKEPKFTMSESNGMEYVLIYDGY